nr:zinc knuckle CX2CX4HX4C [Tanacetum cinerariifolium]
QSEPGCSDVSKNEDTNVKQSFAAMFKKLDVNKAVRITHMQKNGPWLIRLVPLILNIWTPNSQLKKDVITSVLVWVKLYHVPIVAYSEVELSLITSQLGKPIMLDAHTSTVCQKSWGRNTYAHALIDVSALTTLKESIVVAVPYLDEFGYSLEMVDVEYEWQPPRKNGKGKQEGKQKQIAGVRLKPKPSYTYRVVVTRKNGKGKQEGKQKQIAGVRLKHKPSYTYRVVEKVKVLDMSQESYTSDEEVKEHYVEPDPRLSKDAKNDYIGASTPSSMVFNV